MVYLWGEGLSRLDEYGNPSGVTKRANTELMNTRHSDFKILSFSFTMTMIGTCNEYNFIMSSGHRVNASVRKSRTRKEQVEREVSAELKK